MAEATSGQVSGKRGQAHYGSTSLPIPERTISEDTYQPVYEGFDLGFDLSASDMVRTIWSHPMGLLEVACGFDNRHAHLLVFDEPRQQSTDPLSFTALRASRDGGAIWPNR